MTSLRVLGLRFGLLSVVLLVAALATGQEPVDQADRGQQGAAAIPRMALRVRVVKAVPEPVAVLVQWRRGGQGLGGQVHQGQFLSEDGKPELPVGSWSAWLPLEEVVGRPGGWEFPNLLVSPAGGKRGKRDAEGRLQEVAVECAFAEDEKVFRTFTETAPKGATVSFAFPGGQLSARVGGAPGFVAGLQGLSEYVRARRERLEKEFPEAASLPRQFAILGHLAGYGEGTGYGIRHGNPEIVADECRTLRLLGINGLVGARSVELADLAGQGRDFRRLYWGGPGSGSPMNPLEKQADGEGCPFDPALRQSMARVVQAAIEEHHRVGARESWALWWDEIGVAAKEHLQSCPRCREAFLAYLREQHVEPADLGQRSWDDVTPYPIWKGDADQGGGGKKAGVRLAPAPAEAPEALRFYYTYRFMTAATAQLFPEAARELRKAGILLYAMQGPTPSWDGSSLDWHEFYDRGANTALVWETSNRDPQVWQWESYLADIARGIAERHDLPIGCLVKPHRGAPAQRLLSVVVRGARVVEWYTYGPDYAKGDSFSQRPDLLDAVARADRFLGRAEGYLYGAHRAGRPEVAFVSPRSSDIWGKATDLGVTALEDAKWVYLALAHAHVPVDVLSEQQLAEGKLDSYKVLYLVGPNLRRDAAAHVWEWVRRGGLLWTDALGLARDEANQPAVALADLVNGAERRVETWGSVAPYRAINLQPLVEASTPAGAVLSWEVGGAWGKGRVQARVGREPLAAGAAEVLARFADGKAAVLRRRCGKGEVVVVGLWAGLTYSARVRRSDFDMRQDFDPAVRALVVAPALERRVYRPVVPGEALVEAILLEKEGRRCVVLINWGYRQDSAGGNARTLQVVENLRVDLPGAGAVRAVRSLAHGSLEVGGEGADRGVTLPRLEEVDLLLLD